MSNTGGDVYELILENTWQNGEHFYSIWAEDKKVLKKVFLILR